MGKNPHYIIQGKIKSNPHWLIRKLEKHGSEDTKSIRKRGEIEEFHVLIKRPLHENQRSLQMKKDKPCEGEGKEKRREGERFNNETITAMI